MYAKGTIAKNICTTCQTILIETLVGELLTNQYGRKVMPISLWPSANGSKIINSITQQCKSLFNISKVKNISHLTHLQFQYTHIQDLTLK